MKRIKISRKVKNWGGVLALVGLAIWISVAAIDQAVLSAGEGRIFSRADDVQPERVGLVLGTSPTYHGRPNLFFTGRMMAAARLYHAGKVEKLLLSGDNHSADYDEPTAMRKALVKLGVPEEATVLDYAGFRTLDSLVRAKKVFGVDRCIIITDDFHLPRSLYIAQAEGIEAVGFQSAPLPDEVTAVTVKREASARTLIWLQLHIFGTQPKFLGPKEPI